MNKIEEDVSYLRYRFTDFVLTFMKPVELEDGETYFATSYERPADHVAICPTCGEPCNIGGEYFRKFLDVPRYGLHSFTVLHYNRCYCHYCGPGIDGIVEMQRVPVLSSLQMTPDCFYYIIQRRLEGVNEFAVCKEVGLARKSCRGIMTELNFSPEEAKFYVESPDKRIALEIIYRERDRDRVKELRAQRAERKAQSKEGIFLGQPA